MKVKAIARLLVLAVLFSPALSGAADPVKGYQAKVSVTAPTRIDWTFTVGLRSLPGPAPGWLPKDYDSTKQQYELFVPPNYDPKQSYPVVVFISPGTGPAGWSGWESVCKEKGIIFASPYDAGNGTRPPPMRLRIVLDVLDDIRRNYSTDIDRTYICGFSGGGRAAGRIAFSLPEYFGGVVAVGSSGEFREEEWLRHRMIDRLSVALVTGERDFNHGECVLYRGPWMKEVGVRSRVWDVPGMGHSIPGGREFAEVFKWLEDDLPRRRELAKKYPGMRINGAPPPDAWSRVLLAEAKQRLESKETVYSGLMMLRGIGIRYFGMPASAEAFKLSGEYDKKPEKPWDEQRSDDRRQFAYGKALGLTLWVTGHSQYDKVPGSAGTENLNPRAMASEAIQLWEQIVRDGKPAKGVEEAKKHLPELRKIAGMKE